MKNEYDANMALANNKPNFVWTTDNSLFSQPIKVRKELAKYQKIRPCNVSLFDVTMSVIKSIFNGMKG
jgi:hypothetical protein